MSGSYTRRCFILTIRTLLLAVVPILLVSSAAAQHRYDEWHFGYNLSIRFGAGGPAQLSGSSIAALQGCASICDPVTGDLLFYTNGSIVWNRDHTKMPNGAMLAGGYSAVQAALIVPMPDDADRYYIFTTDETESPLQPNGYYYSIVDMRLDGGRGDVAAKNAKLLPETSEHQTAVPHCNGRDFWVIAHANSGNEFYAFLVGPGGVAAQPVVSALGAFTDGYGNSMGRSPQGALKASPDGTKLAAVFGNGTVELYAFDRQSGRLSRPLRLKDAGSPHFHPGVSFSPDGTRLYTSFSSGLFQYSLESGDPATIIASSHAISYADGSDLQLGPDGKIYRREFRGLGVIHEPNLPSAECRYVEGAIPIAFNVSYGLPNNIDAIDAPAGSVRASIPRDLATNPGKMLEAPILLDAPVSGPAGAMTITLRYDSTMLRLVTDDPFLGTTTDGTLLAGWGMSDVTDRPGLFIATLTPPSGAGALAAAGRLLRLRFRTFISAKDGSTPALVSELPFEIESPGGCGPVLTSTGRAQLELCGLSLRMIESTVAKYALDGIMPNPFRGSAEIRFSIGLDGPTRVEVFDAEGSSAAILADREMTAGDYLLTWDANRFPSGLYYCRITSGSWSVTERMKLMK